MRKLTAIVAALTMTLAVAPVNVAAWGSAEATGGVRGTVMDKSGLPLTPGLQARLVNSQGNSVPGMTSVVAPGGMYVLNNVAPGMYTVQINGAVGMSAVTVTAGKVSTANVTVVTQQSRGLSRTTKLLIAAAVAGGAVVAVIALKNDASGSK